MNCQIAEKTLAEVWSEAVFDAFPVIAGWRWGLNFSDVEMPTQERMAIHVRPSQYFLQVVKCSNAECCAPMVSALKTVLPHGFLHAPLAVTNTDSLKVDEAAGTFLPIKFPVFQLKWRLLVVTILTRCHTIFAVLL